jgi:hypothetical protein
MARQSDIENEKKLKELQAENAKLQNGYQKTYEARQKQIKKNAIEIAELEKKITNAKKAQTAAVTANIQSAKTIGRLTSDREKLEEKTNKSLSTRLQQLVKGNVASAIGLKTTRDYETAQVNLAKQAEDNAKNVSSLGLRDEQQKSKVVSLQQDIKDGLLSQADIKTRVNDIGIKDGDISKKVLKTASSLREQQKGVASAGVLSSNNMTKFAGKAAIAGVIFKKLFDIAQKFAASVDAIGKQFGSLNALSGEFKNELLDAQVAVVGVGATMEDVVATTNALSSEFGFSTEESANLSAQIIDTARAVGLSNEEAAKLSGILQTTSGLSGAQAERLTEGAYQLAAMNKVNPSAVLKDMAGSSEAFAMFSKDGGDNIAKAAVQARGLGLSLDTTSKIAEGLLDFEQSISAEVEASAILGRQLNFQKARELALTNDLEGAMKEVVKQVGTEAEFNKLMLPQRQALAKSIGVSVGDLAKMVANQDKANMLAGETAQSFSDMIGKDAMSELTQAMNSLKIFGVALARVLGPVLEGFGKLINFGLDPLASIVGGVSVNDFKSGPGGITTMMGPAGVFSLNPRDSVLATTNPIPVNDISMGPAGSKSVGGGNMNVTFGDATFQNDKLRLAVVNPPDTTRSL